ncbi:L-threonylcarbamoyladenylate synthase [Butyrivibrio sp. LC3010]|uniref:L-threonylcarbamoyladenylate synthase n=1 Tax=Butyrivibrio sp. LC3010 TaxID=1280680 RepID=UPI0003FA43D7|nr:L-threonylcarbamoyladenylate synthase [Butyrivibrio sp. LC3010]
METIVEIIDENNIDDKALAVLKKAGDILKNGGLVAFPTETVYGLGGDALNPESSKKIYAAKGRPSDNPLIVHVADMESLKKIVDNIPDAAYKLADVLWPGPLTMIMNKSDAVPYETTGGLNTVAIRMPSNKIAAELIRQAGGYIAAPSANISGRPSPTEAKYCIEDLDGRVEMIIDGGSVGIGLESTIIDLTVDTPMILRPGYVTQKMLEDILGGVSIDKTILSATSGVKPKAPGMKYRHYAPKGELTIVEGKPEAVTAFINEQTGQHSANGEKCGVIATTETFSLYKADVVKCAGCRDDEEEIARNLFRILREFDDENVDCMFSEAFDENGIGQAIMNRLLKAAGHRVIKV